MAIHAICPGCQFPYVLRDDQAGEQFTCLGCERKFVLPQPEILDTLAVRAWDEPAPEPLHPLRPPAAVIEYVVAEDHDPLILSVLGVATLDYDLAEGRIFRALVNLRPIYVVMVLFALTLLFLTTRESAMDAAPMFLFATLFTFLGMYFFAVIIGQRHNDDHANNISGFSAMVLQPLMVVLNSDRSLPVIRAGLLGCLLGSATALMGVRVGTFTCLVPEITLASAPVDAPGITLPHEGTILKLPSDNEPAPEVAPLTAPAAISTPESAAIPAQTIPPPPDETASAASNPLPPPPPPPVE